MIEITPKQAQYIREAHHRWNFAVGAVRSGKSYIAVRYIIPTCLRERVGKRGINLILGASKENIERNVLAPMRDIWGAKLVSDIDSRNRAVVFGEKVYCIGAENIRQVSKLRGSEIKFCYCDEVCDINKEVFEMLKSRLSLPYSICHGACNPSYPTHFIKEFIDSGPKGVDVYCQEFTIYDNPFLPPEYVRGLEAEYAGTVYYLRYILGKWARAEGLVFPMFVEALGGPSETPPSAYVLSIDYGTQNAFAALLWSKRGSVWYAEREYYYSGRSTGQQKTDEEYGADLNTFTEGVCGDPRWPDSPIPVIIDPSAASFIALLRRKGRYKVRPANNSVADGLRETASAMREGLIKISPTLKHWRQEVEGYVWDEKTDDTPVKEDDHLMDATRYFVKTMHVLRRRDDYTPIMGS